MTPSTAARQASLSFTISRSSLKLMSIESTSQFGHYFPTRVTAVLLRREARVPSSSGTRMGQPGWPGVSSYPAGVALPSAGQDLRLAVHLWGLQGDSRASLRLSDPVPLGGAAVKALEADEIRREGQQEKKRTRRILKWEWTRPLNRKGAWARGPSSVHLSNEEGSQEGQPSPKAPLRLRWPGSSWRWQGWARE